MGRLPKATMDCHNGDSFNALLTTGKHPPAHKIRLHCYCKNKIKNIALGVGGLIL